MRSRRPLAAAFLAALLSCSDSSGPNGGLKSASALATQLEAIDHAIATPQLKSLGALALPVLNLGIDVHTISSITWGRTIEWNEFRVRYEFTQGTGAPADALRLILYTLDSTGHPASPIEEIGHADLYPFNEHNGGGPDSMSLRYVVTDTRTTPTVVADFLAHSHADSACQCATVEGWASDGTTRVDFSVPYEIPLDSDGRFPGSFTASDLSFEHVATLPGPGASAATANLTLVFAGDTITTMSGELHPHAGRLEGEVVVMINGAPFTTVTRTAAGISATGPGGRPLTNAERRALAALFDVPADIAYYIEWPTFVIFFCGC
ncbi:MAG TPA: hypothetical protein VGQ48_07260 [Gemmatimonadales bacterium]|jgi:hypothetical protein|nr:hypothetical protein [Gemmatimonadales bacterium]